MRDIRSSRSSWGSKRYVLALLAPAIGNFIQVPVALAQPIPIRVIPKKVTPLSLEQKRLVKDAFAVIEQEKACRTTVDLKVENANLLTVIAQLRELLPAKNLAVEVRGELPVSVSFNLKQTKVGNVLEHVAGLAGSKLYLLPAGLLICSTSQLTGDERLNLQQSQGGDWATNMYANGTGWVAGRNPNHLFTTIIAQEAFGTDGANFPQEVIEKPFDSFSSESQCILKEMADGLNARTPNIPPVLLTPSTPIKIDASRQNAIGIAFPSPLSGGGISKGTTTVIIQ